MATDATSPQPKAIASRTQDLVRMDGMPRNNGGQLCFWLLCENIHSHSPLILGIHTKRSWLRAFDHLFRLLAFESIYLELNRLASNNANNRFTFTNPNSPQLWKGEVLKFAV